MTSTNIELIVVLSKELMTVIDISCYKVKLTFKRSGHLEVSMLGAVAVGLIIVSSAMIDKSLKNDRSQ